MVCTLASAFWCLRWTVLSRRSHRSWEGGGGGGGAKSISNQLRFRKHLLKYPTSHLVGCDQVQEEVDTVSEPHGLPRCLEEKSERGRERDKSRVTTWWYLARQEQSHDLVVLG